MNAPSGQLTPTARPLMTHQRAFVESIFATGSKRVHLLSAAPGSGKSTALIATAQRLLSEDPGSRLLILALASHGAQMGERLRSLAVPVLLVDRYRFRELKDVIPDGPVWPKGMVVILSLDFAKQPDIRASLVAVPWEMIIVDYGPLTGARAEVIKILGASADRVIIATDSRIRGDDLFSRSEATAVQWRREDFIDQAGRPLAGLRPLLNESNYALTLDELHLVAAVGAVCAEVDTLADGPGSYRSEALRRQLQSSQAALESGLRALSVESIAADGNIGDPKEANNAPFDLSPHDPPNYAVVARIRDMTAQVLAELDKLEGDSKLTAFLSLIKNSEAKTRGTVRVVVVTRYTSTLFYLASALEDTGIPALLFHNDMDEEARNRSLLAYADRGGPLLATQAMLQGIDLPHTTDVILYEVPDTKQSAVPLVSLERFWRTTPLNVHVLVPINCEDRTLSHGLHVLREVIG
jgi:hypothetical protein